MNDGSDDDDEDTPKKYNKEILEYNYFHQFQREYHVCQLLYIMRKTCNKKKDI